jgi:hypothetical protein
MIGNQALPAASTQAEELKAIDVGTRDGPGSGA